VANQMATSIYIYIYISALSLIYIHEELEQADPVPCDLQISSPKSKISSCGNRKQNTIVSKVAIYARNDYVLGDTDKKPLANLRQILVIGGGLDSTLFQTKHL